ncbi:Wzz/FepE/Etk N-terminal domain-containing protein [Aquabacterium sp. J223]|uniref:Wzz/FepE/Etk N-terminal domain-containing protein n=1 Tax=Aquabacterium sp. J223 TaxID=2898431 RepID=UPI0021ADCE0F|nr:Wzz/FepE/Etk N-terminal domain-containing protein [Aquabacterium sp. J223]UUX96780.1 Wzz/FepE/Etk N-terminal domain-containing protein [Aquabacterium sp. J223]
MNARVEPHQTPGQPSYVEDDDDGLTLPELVDAIRPHWKKLVFLPLLAGLLAYGVAFLIPPTYTAKTTLMPPQQQQSGLAGALSSLGSLGALAGLGGGAGVKTPGDQYIALLQSASVSNRLIDQFKLMDVYESKYREDARKALDKRAKFTLGKKDGLITVEVDDREPQRAADMANAYVEELRRFTNTLAVTEAQQRRVFFEGLLKRTRDQLTTAQQAMERSGLSQGALKSEPRAAAENYARLQAQVTAAEVRVQTLRSNLNNDAPEVVQAISTLSALRSQLARAERPANEGGDSDYVSRYREFKYQETLFELFARQYELARVDESREGALIQVVDPAVAPERRSAPKRVLIAAGAALVALVLLGMGLMVRHAWRGARRTPPAAA